MSRRILPFLILLAACARAGTTASTRVPPVATAERTRALLSALADDSMEGRRWASPGEARAARFIAARFKDAGLTPGGDSGNWFQKLPVAQTTVRRQQPNGQVQVRTFTQLLPSFADLDTIPAERRLTSVNVLGVLRGADPALSSEFVVLGAHFDALGIRPAVNGDSIVNGADDDGSGVVAVLESARIIASGPRPKRTIIFATFTGEEAGAQGTIWFSKHPNVPIERIVADIQVEMIGRPDSIAGGPGKGALTGFERSTMGPALVAAGLPVTPDARPEMRFFERSDNIVFARLGIVAHTLSSYNMHTDYHTVNDEVDRVDFDHMSQMVNLIARAVRTIADGPRLQWNPGGRP